jgi:hypothetical protein
MNITVLRQAVCFMKITAMIEENILMIVEKSDRWFCFMNITELREAFCFMDIALLRKAFF